MKGLRSAGRPNSKTGGVSVREAAKLLGCGLKRVYDLVWSGQLEATRINQRWCIPVRAVEKRIRARQDDVT
jgi:excisionase family DNA binding protein